MKKRYFVISDIEMGKKDVMGDFSDDDHLIEFIQNISHQTEEKVYLILNGDIFDFLKMDYQGEYGRYITEEISLWKLDQIFQAHFGVFKALADFLQEKNHFMYFVIGNHDFDVVWPKVQTKLKVLLNNNDRIHFGFTFEDEALHVEHGHSLDPFFEHDIHRPFVDFCGQKILNLPIGSQIVFSYLAPFKKRFPKEEQLYPRAKVVLYYPEYNRAMKRMQWFNIWKVALNRLRHFNDPTYRLNYRAFIRHVIKFGFDFIDDHRFLSSRLKELHQRHPHKQIFVLGHTHIFNEIEYENKRFLLTDTWRDEYSILIDGHPKKKKTYAEIYRENALIKEAEVKIFTPDSKRIHHPLKENLTIQQLINYSAS